jgi:Uncharacterized protein conserved in bacteria
MYEKDLSVSLLMDFYSEILTDKQREVISLYYDEDLSLAEIAEEAKITRQGVRDSIKRGEATLREMEEKLGLADRFSKQKAMLEKIGESAVKIQSINQRFRYSREIGELAAEIQADLEALNEKM